MSSNHFGIIIAPLEVVINLIEFIGSRTNRKIIKENVRYALISRRKWNNSQCSFAGDKTLRSKANSQAARWLAQIVRVAGITETEFIDSASSKGLRIAQNCQLCAPRI